MKQLQTATLEKPVELETNLEKKKMCQNHYLMTIITIWTAKKSIKLFSELIVVFCYCCFKFHISIYVLQMFIQHAIKFNYLGEQLKRPFSQRAFRPNVKCLSFFLWPLYADSLQTCWTLPETFAPVRRLLPRTRSRSSRISGSSLSGNGWHGCKRQAGMCTPSACKQTLLLYIRTGCNDPSLKSTIPPHNKHCRSPHRSSLVVQRPKKPKHTGRRSPG